MFRFMRITSRLYFLIFGFVTASMLMVPSTGNEAKPVWSSDLASLLNESVDKRLRGLKGGEPNMAVFSIYEHLYEAYSRNEGLWCADLGKELTGVATFKVGPGKNMSIADSYGGVMITRRHILFCNHAHPAYPGSPPPWVNGLGFRTRFVTSENEIIERNLVWGRRVNGQDLWIGLLDEDLPETVKSYRIMPIIDGVTNARDKVVEVGFSQGSSRLTPAANHIKFDQLCGRCETSHYGTHTEVDGVKHYQQLPMVYVSNLGTIDCSGSKGSELRAPFRYCVWDGDSGTPRFHLFGSELLLSRIILTGGGGGLTLGDKTAKLNEAISEIDQEAMEQSKIEALTNYQVEVVSLQELESAAKKR